MEYRGSEIRAGAFVLAAAITLTVLIFAVGGFPLTTGTVMVRTELDQVRFLKPGDKVTYAGHPVGAIVSVRRSPSDVRKLELDLRVDRRMVIPEGSKVVLKQDGILGQKYLEIVPPKPGQGTLTPIEFKESGDPVVLAGEAPPGLVDLGASLEEPVEKLNHILAKIDVFLSEEATQSNLRGVLQGARDFVGKLNETVERIGPEVYRAFKEAGDLLAENRGRVGTTLQNVESVSADLVRRELPAKAEGVLNDVHVLLRRADDVVMDNYLNLYLTIRHAREAAYHAEIFTQKIRANPAVLLFGGTEATEFRSAVDFSDWRLDGRAPRYGKEE